MLRNIFSGHNPNSSLPAGEGPGEREKLLSCFPERLFEIGRVVRRMRRQMRFGELSRAPLRLRLLQLRDAEVECDLIARPADPWDADMPDEVRERNVTMQALEDAMAVRKLLFRTLPGVDSATLRIYRPAAEGAFELIIAGTSTREEPGVRVLSLVMRAILCGFKFHLDDGVLKPLQA